MSSRVTGTVTFKKGSRAVLELSMDENAQAGEVAHMPGQGPDMDILANVVRQSGRLHPDRAPVTQSKLRVVVSNITVPLKAKQKYHGWTAELTAAVIEAMSKPIKSRRRKDPLPMLEDHTDHPSQDVVAGQIGNPAPDVANDDASQPPPDNKDDDSSTSSSSSADSDQDGHNEDSDHNEGVDSPRVQQDSRDDGNVERQQFQQGCPVIPSSHHGTGSTVQELEDMMAIAEESLRNEENENDRLQAELTQAREVSNQATRAKNKAVAQMWMMRKEMKRMRAK